jgi:hypothetical protein
MNTDQEITIETKTPRRWWRPQFTIVQMLLAFLIVALCVANWLSRQEIEEVRFANRFYSSLTDLDIQQYGSCTVKEIIHDQDSNPLLHTRDYEIFIVLNPHKSYKIYSAIDKVDSFDKNAANISVLYVNKNNRHVVAKILLTGQIRENISPSLEPKNTDFVTYQIQAWLHESSATLSSYKNTFLKKPKNLSLWNLPTSIHNPITTGNHDLTKPLTLLKITDATDEIENTTGIHIWLEEVK